MMHTRHVSDRGGLVFNNTGSSPAHGESLFTDFGKFVGSKSDIDFYRRQFNGKRILNLGSGHNGYITQYLRDLAPQSHLVSIDPSSPGGFNRTQVRGVAQKLPFTTGVFDLVISTWSFPLFWAEALRGLHLANGDPIPRDSVLADLEKASSELSRVISDGGEAWLSPLEMTIEPETLSKVENDHGQFKELAVAALARSGLTIARVEPCFLQHNDDTFIYEAGIFKKTC